MSWDQTFNLPRTDYTHEEILAAVKKAVAVFEGVELEEDNDDEAASDPFEKDFEDEDEDDEQWEFHVRIPPSLLREEGDDPENGPDDDGFYHCVFSVYDDDPWCVNVHSNEADNRDANLAVSAVAGYVAELLGGGDVEPL